MWKMMKRVGYPEKVIRFLESLYKEIFSAVRVDAEVTEWFETIVGVLQGCMLSPLLFNIFLEVIMASSMEEMKTGAVMNGRIINNLRFADDIAVMAENQDDLQVLINRIVAESTRMGMKVNIAKTEVQHIGIERTKVDIQIENHELKQVEEFVYLGGNISEDSTTEQDTRRRIGLVCGTMQTL